jgi:hypothetical protein
MRLGDISRDGSAIAVTRSTGASTLEMGVLINGNFTIIPTPGVQRPAANQTANMGVLLEATVLDRGIVRPGQPFVRNADYLANLGIELTPQQSSFIVMDQFSGDGNSNAGVLDGGGRGQLFILKISTPQCDPIDFNNDSLFPTDEDVIDFLTVLAGGQCSNAPNCFDIDFNNDGLFPSDEDLIAFLRVFAGGDC